MNKWNHSATNSKGPKPSLVIKILLDITMFITYLFLVFGWGTSDFFHEVAGIGIGGMYALHLFLNRNWIKNLLNGKLKKKKDIINIVFDSSLFIGMILIIVTGVLISNVLFVNDLPIPFGLIFDIHNVASFVILAVLGLHVLVHLKYMYLASKNIIKNFVKSNTLKACCGYASITIVICVLYVQIQARYNFNAEFLQDISVTPSPTPMVVVSESPSASSYPKISSENSSNVEDSRKTTNSDTNETISEDVNGEVTQTSESLGEGSSSEFIEESTPSTTPPPTLEEYLSSITCTACGKGCLLISPRCNKGLNQASIAKAEYAELYA